MEEKDIKTLSLDYNLSLEEQTKQIKDYAKTVKDRSFRVQYKNNEEFVDCVSIVDSNRRVDAYGKEHPLPHVKPFSVVDVWYENDVNGRGTELLEDQMSIDGVAEEYKNQSDWQKDVYMSKAVKSSDSVFAYTQEDVKTIEHLTPGQMSDMNRRIKRTLFLNADSNLSQQSMAINKFAKNGNFGTFFVEYVDKDGFCVDSTMAVDLRKNLEDEPDRFDFYGDDRLARNVSVSEFVELREKQPFSPNHELTMTSYKGYADEKAFQENKGVDVCYLYDEKRKANKPVLFITSVKERDGFIKPHSNGGTKFDGEAYKSRLPYQYKDWKVFFHESYDDVTSAMAAMKERMDSFSKYSRTPDWKQMVDYYGVKCTSVVADVYDKRLPKMFNENCIVNTNVASKKGGIPTTNVQRGNDEPRKSGMPTTNVNPEKPKRRLPSMPTTSADSECQLGE
jgi:hypothetical protein